MCIDAIATKPFLYDLLLNLLQDLPISEIFFYQLMLGQHQIQPLWIHVWALQEDKMSVNDVIKS